MESEHEHEKAFSHATTGTGNEENSRIAIKLLFLRQILQQKPNKDAKQQTRAPTVQNQDPV